MTHTHTQVINLRYFNPVGAHPSGMMGEDPAGTRTHTRTRTHTHTQTHTHIPTHTHIHINTNAIISTRYYDG